jgi:hypothetical protein
MRRLFNINPNIFNFHKHAPHSKSSSHSSCGANLNIKKVEFNNVKSNEIKEVSIDNEINVINIYKKQEPQKKTTPKYFSYDDFENAKYIKINEDHSIALKTEDKVSLTKKDKYYECDLPNIDFNIIDSISINS